MSNNDILEELAENHEVAPKAINVLLTAITREMDKHYKKGVKRTMLARAAAAKKVYPELKPQIENMHKWIEENGGKKGIAESDEYSLNVKTAVPTFELLYGFMIE